VSYEYPGSELELFAKATNWKTYISSVLVPHIHGRVLEVGAGMGSNVVHLDNETVTEWTSLEPDERLARHISDRIARGELPAKCRSITGTLADLPSGSEFDTILYIDVLEHIADDALELVRAGERLASLGKLLVLAPAHQSLFSPFDAAIGHHRRYNRAMLTAIAPPQCQLLACRMLDSAGFFVSLANRVLFRSAMPSASQIELWDRYLVPAGRILDKATGFRFGKTIVMIWRGRAECRSSPRSAETAPPTQTASASNSTTQGFSEASRASRTGHARDGSGPVARVRKAVALRLAIGFAIL
jgi:SAM-dependent methyltransferase